MSWPQWTGGAQPAVPALNPAPPVINPAPAVVPPGMQYTPEQWAQMQQQNWSQWAQWQQQYQQWHQQYGAEYQKSMNAIAQAAQQPALPNVAVPPPLPLEKPPLPTEDPPFSSAPPPYSSAPPSFNSAPPTSYNAAPPPPPPQYKKQPPVSYNTQGYNKNVGYNTGNKRGQWQGQQNYKRPFEGQEAKRPMGNKPWPKPNVEELSEAEKKFDKQFADWEAQFNKWKEQNAEHPDKEQYKEYEKKWESWRAQLLERREQMRRKRLGLLGDAPRKAPLSAKSNQSQEGSPNEAPPLLGPPTAASPLVSFANPPPSMNDEPLKFKNEKAVPELEDDVGDFIKPSTGGGIPGLDLVRDDPRPKEDDVVLVEHDEKPKPDFDAISKGLNSILGDKNLMNMLSLVSQNQSKPVDNLINTVSKITENSMEQQSNQSFEEQSNHSESFGQNREFVQNFDDQTRSSFTHNENEVNFNRNQNQFGNNFKGGRFDFQSNQNKFGLDSPGKFGFNPGQNKDRFEDNQDRFGPNQSQFGPSPDRFGFNPDRFAQNQDRFGPHQDRFGPNQDKFAPNQNKFGPNQNRFGLNQDKFGPNQDRFNQGRFGFNQDRFGNNQESFGPNQGRFGFGSNQNMANKPSVNEDKFGLNQNRFRDRFGPNQDKFGDANQNRFAPNQERFPPNPPRFGPDPGFDKDNFGPSPHKFGRYSEENQENYEEEEEEPYDEYDYDSVAANFETPEEPLEKPVEKQEFLQAATVIDYDHKPLKPPEPEVLIEPIYMFDYRHKPLSRIPLPQRPKWLSDTVKNIREFDPPSITRPPFERRIPRDVRFGSDERYQEWPRQRTYPPYDDRRSFDRRPFDRPPDRSYDRPADDQRSFTQSFQDLEEENISDTEWPEEEEPPQKTVFPKFEEVEKPKANINKNLVPIDDIINAPGRFKRPPRIVIILRGPPGSGKTYLAKLIKDKEVENGGSAPRILSLDDYFMIEQEKEVKEDGKIVKVKEMVYEYEAEMEESYRMSLVKSFKKTITDGYFSFIIVDNVNDKVKYFGEMWSFAKQNGFQVYICQLDLDVQTCSKRNIHGRSEADIQKCVSSWEPTPSHHPILDATTLLQSASIPEVEMEEVNSPESDLAENSGSEDHVARSKWDNFDCSVDNLAKLDGLSKPLRQRTMEEYLQLDTEWTPIKPTKPGQKRVRWADLEEQKEQEKMRAIGFVVGHTNWDRMLDPTGGSSALTQTKYIERTGRHKLEPK